jgi:hypothetical protein
MPTTAAVLDILQSLLEAEQASVFRFMRSGNPYLTRATLETRDRVDRMAAGTERRAAELGELIERIGGTTRPRPVQPEDQYLAFLSLKFLLPKLAEAKRMAIERYENALRALKGSPAEVIGVLERQLAEHREDLAVLEAERASAT